MHPGGRHILVVDHDPVRRLQIIGSLLDEGFEVAGAAEGLAAVRAAGQRRFALVVAALGLPGSLDGPATVHQLRVRQPRIRALYTADTTERLHCPVRDNGDVVPWPFKRSELLGCVFEMLQRDPFADTLAVESGGRAFRRR